MEKGINKIMIWNIFMKKCFILFGFSQDTKM